MSTDPTKIYTEEFFTEISEGTSAAIVVPVVLQYVQPDSVVDLGCGLGGWLAEFKQRGATEVLGIDGDYVPRHLLQIPPKCFLAADLTQPLNIGRRFDLAVSLEVAEHLPESSATSFVATLTDLAPVVLFSAAIPFQGGNHHINLQWPEYWADLFARRGFEVIDCIRELVWWNPRVSWWYSQNTFFFVSPEGFARHPALQAIRNGERKPLRAVHPDNYVSALNHVQHPPLRQLLAQLPGATWRTVWRRLGLSRREQKKKFGDV